MTEPLLHIPIAVSLGADNITIAYDSDRITIESGLPTLTLERPEAVIFEIADFVVNGTTYRVNARDRHDRLDWARWQRATTGCQSPIFSEGLRLEIEITATPVATPATPRSHTSTTVINKKGKPFNLDL